MTRVLLIEDDGLVRHALKLALEVSGMDVSEASNGQEALSRDDLDSMDVIVTDIFMPEVEGIETVLRLKSLDLDVPIIAISGGGRVNGFDYLESARELGVDATFAKPLDERELVKKIRELTAISG